MEAHVHGGHGLREPDDRNLGSRQYLGSGSKRHLREELKRVPLVSVGGERRLLDAARGLRMMVAWGGRRQSSAPFFRPSSFRQRGAVDAASAYGWRSPPGRGRESPRLDSSLRPIS